MNNPISALIADDEDLIRSRLKMTLSPWFKVGEADAIAEARRKWKCDFDLALLDIKFPDGNGIELCREIKAEDPHFTVIMSSSMEEVEAWDESFKAGADGYFEKRELMSLDPRKIRLTIMSLVERNLLRRQAEETAQRQKDLLSVLSHDVRAPFQAMLRGMEMIRLSNPPKEISEEVDTLYKCASGQLEFINSLLEILRLESGAARLRITPIDINLPVNQSVQNLGPAIKAKELELQMDLGQEIPNVHCDIARVSQLVTNLLSNAIKFTPRHGIVKISTSYSQNSNLGCAEVSIEDSGEGIEPEHRERLMKRFIRGKAGGSDGEQGSGLGLSICKEIVNLHSGALIIGESPLGGAMVRARLPLGGAADGQESGSEDRMAPGPQRVIARRP